MFNASEHQMKKEKKKPYRFLKCENNTMQLDMCLCVFRLMLAGCIKSHQNPTASTKPTDFAS